MKVDVKLVRDPKGLITKFQMHDLVQEDDSIEQSDLINEFFLEHYGVKGMKWGVRKSRSGSSGTAEDNRSADRKRVDELLKQPRKSLSNKELQEITSRMNLEQQVSRLNPGSVARGSAKATAILGTLGIGIQAYNMLKSPAGQALVGAGKAAVKKALSG